jgi:hypothetical protein
MAHILNILGGYFLNLFFFFFFFFFFFLHNAERNTAVDWMNVMKSLERVGSVQERRKGKFGRNGLIGIQVYVTSRRRTEEGFYFSNIHTRFQNAEQFELTRFSLTASISHLNLIPFPVPSPKPQPSAPPPPRVPTTSAAHPSSSRPPPIQTRPSTPSTPQP